LYKKYKVENKELLKELKDDTNDVLTNERKTYYEDQRIDGLKFYYYYFLVTIYVICVICFAAFSFIYPSHSSFGVRVATLIGLIALPFVSSWILGNIIALVYKAYSLLPKNVYR
jgi:lipopolysaccharide export LptBFGC system permease protein LptF